MKSRIIIIIENQYADWELVYLMSAFYMLKKTQYEIKILAYTKEVIKSNSGFYMMPEYDIDTIPEEYEALVLISSKAEIKDGLLKWKPVFERCLKEKKILASASDLSGVLEEDLLKQVVTSRNSDALEFVRAVIEALKIGTKKEMMRWYHLQKIGVNEDDISNEVKDEWRKGILSDQRKLEKLSEILIGSEVGIFEYYPIKDCMVTYNQYLEVEKEVPNYLHVLERDDTVHSEDRWKVREFFKGALRGPLEVRVKEDDEYQVKTLYLYPIEGVKPTQYMLGCIRNTSSIRESQIKLEERARRDSLTKLYNNDTGQDLVNRYLEMKNPYDSCGLMVIDIDFFKNVNDNYGHLFGDEVLIALSQLLLEVFDKKDIIIRAGGDEFVVFLKDISHVTLLKKSNVLIKAVRTLRFDPIDYSMTCSVGVCYLPENAPGYTYNQLFHNADWALYQAKEKGRNRYVFCDSLKRFDMGVTMEEGHSDIDARYLQNDIIASAFEIFEKQSDFHAAMELLLEVIGIRFQLDRITVMKTNIKEKKTSKLYQWRSKDAPLVLETPASFQKQDFLTLFHSYDEYGTTVLHYDSLDHYSKGAKEILMQGEAKTVVYAAMYSEGQYIGAISYVVCQDKRYWTKTQRSQLGEIAKIVSAHLTRNQAMNTRTQSLLDSQEFDSLTGLLSFASFREEVERMIIGDYAKSHAMIYVDFCGFKKFNLKYGYQAGDQLLKDFAAHVASCLENYLDVYFTRVSADQFIIFLGYSKKDDLLQMAGQINQSFLEQQKELYPEEKLQMRTGIYFITSESENAAQAIDAANYARMQVHTLSKEEMIRVFDEELYEKRNIENDMLETFDLAIKNHQFKVFIQPRFSLKDMSLTGGEAMVRWKREDGTLLYPDDFLRMYEKSGKIIELDFFVFEEVVKFLAKCRKMGRKPIPLSVNASTLHAQNNNTAKRYSDILKKYEIDPNLLEIEFTESDTISYYTSVKEMLNRLRKVNLTTALDAFGKSYSRLNMTIDVPVNTVKLDRSFICTCESSEKGVYFLKQMVEMVKGLGHCVVCEGVETKQQVELLTNAGCDEAQGYLFAYPMPLEEFEKRLYEGDGFNLQKD